MRMWMIDPKFLCRKHLLGEHGEIHKFRHNFIKKHKMGKRVQLGQIDHKNMSNRHNELALEMLTRGYKHMSPYVQPDISYIKEELNINIANNMDDLGNRCAECRELMKGGKK